MSAEASIVDSTTDASQEFVGQWNQLVSTTNWEKGKIIAQWRQSLVESGARPSEYADDAWAHLVGGVTPQHIGRLRRVHERFGATYGGYQGLYWSHFFTALDWDDAEMWLEGAVQNDWSVSQTKKQRWETLGSVPGGAAMVEEDGGEEIDEDFDPASDGSTPNIAATLSEVVEPVLDPDAASSGGTDTLASISEPGSVKEDSTAESSAKIYAEDDQETVSFVRSFANLSELPEDLTEAFESFKLAILRHKLTDWSEVSREDVLASLDALRELASSPTTESMPS